MRTKIDDFGVIRTERQIDVRSASTKKTIIEPSSRTSLLDMLREVWNHRETLYFFAWRDIKVRYKQTVLGAAWAILQPVFLMVVFSLFFGRLAKLPTGGIPYPVFSFAALLPWQLFANGLSEASSSLIANERILSKVYFPRLIIPIAGVCVGIIDFAIAFGVLGLLMFWYKVTPTINVLFLPLFTAMAVLVALAVGVWLAALNSLYRDVRYTIGFLIQLWFFCTPVVYSSAIVPARWRGLLALNPMTGVIEGFRWALFGDRYSVPLILFAGSAAVVLIILVTGIYYFRSVDVTLADRI